MLFSGTLGAKQGLGVLLDAATRLSDQRHLPFAVAGEGPAKADLIAKYDTLPTLPTVHFLPFPALGAGLGFLGVGQSACFASRSQCCRSGLAVQTR